MQKVIIFLFAFFGLKSMFAQLAIIKDLDGFSNIRVGAGNQSKIVDTISNGRLVFCFVEEAKGHWLPIDYNKEGKHQSGYIHQSRLAFVDDLPKFSVTTVSDTVLKLQYDSFQVTIKTGKFVSKARIIKYEKPQDERQYVKSIDGKFPWGTDGNIPRNEYKLIQLKSGKRLLRIKRTDYGDVFEPNLQMTAAYIDKTTHNIYIEAFNSDGAGGYVAVWIIKDEQIANREIFHPF